MRQKDPATATVEIVFMQTSHGLDLPGEQVSCPAGEHGDSVFVALARPDDDMTFVDANM